MLKLTRRELERERVQGIVRMFSFFWFPGVVTLRDLKVHFYMQHLGIQNVMACSHRYCFPSKFRSRVPLRRFISLGQQFPGLDMSPL